MARATATFLFMSTGKLSGHCLRVFLHAHKVEERLHFLLDLAPGKKLVVGKGKGHVLKNVHGVEQRAFLEQHPGLARIRRRSFLSAPTTSSPSMVMLPDCGERSP